MPSRSLSVNSTPPYDTEVAKYPLLGSCRLVYTICAFFTLLNFILMRFNLSFALVCMVSLNGTTSQRPPAGCPSTASPEHPGDVVTGEFDWNKALQGRILSAFFYGYVASQGFGGWFSDRFGGKLLFILGNLLQSIFTLLLPMAARQHVELLFALRVLQGIVCGLSLPSVFQLYTRWAAPEERTRLMGFAYTGFPLGNVIIFPLSGALCRFGLDRGWPSIFYVTGLFGLVCSLAFCFLVYDNADKHPRISAEERDYLNSCTVKDSPVPLKVPWKSIWSSGPVYAYHIAHFCYSWGFVTLAVNLPLFMKEVLFFDLTQNGFLSAVPYLAVLFMRIFISTTFAALHRSSKLSLTTFRKINHTIGSLGAGLSMMLITYLTCTDQYLAVLVITVSQAVMDLAFTGGYLLSFLDLAPQYAGLLTGLSNAIGSLPGVISPTLVGILTPNSTREEWMVVLYITTGFYFLGTISYLILGSSDLQSWATDSPITQQLIAKNREVVCSGSKRTMGQTSYSSI